MTTFLVVALLAQTPNPPAPAPPEIQDFAFALVQESWVRDCFRLHRIERFLDRADRDLLQRLGCEHYACRQDAETHIRELGFRAARLLSWGAASKDLDTATRSRKLLGELWQCRTCDGTGNCSRCEPGSYHDRLGCAGVFRWNCVCPACGGSGRWDLQLVDYAWSEGDQYPVFGPRSVFDQSAKERSCTCQR